MSSSENINSVPIPNSFYKTSLQYKYMDSQQEATTVGLYMASSCRSTLNTVNTRYFIAQCFDITKGGYICQLSVNVENEDAVSFVETHKIMPNGPD